MKPPLPRDGHVWLSLSEEAPPDGFHLEIPTRIIAANCRYPIKYLRYLAWCILSRRVTIRSGDQNLDDDSEIHNQGIYLAQLEQGTDWYGGVVALEAVKRRSEFRTLTQNREGFRNTVEPRDASCIFCEIDACEACHIIPFVKGDAWLTAINKGRHSGYPAAARVNDINDLRNGFLLGSHLHKAFDDRVFSIMKIPNKIIALEDVHCVMPNAARQQSVVSYKKTITQNYQYVYQWIVPPLVMVPTHIRNNTVGLFVQGAKQKDLPSPLLLDYHYGASALIHWGQQHGKLGKPAHMPEQAAPVPLGPSTKRQTSFERAQTLKKRGKLEDDQEAGPSSGQPPHHPAEGEALEVESSTVQERPIRYSGPGYVMHGFTVEEAEEMVLGFWMSTPEARAEWEKEENEKSTNIEKWRKEVT